jgi:taurine--2-oxoglutarate transaminase
MPKKPTNPTWHELHRERLFFTWSVQSAVGGFEITDAKGVRFKAAGAGWMWDMQSQIYNVSVGHNHPHLQHRMIQQIVSLPAAHPHALLPIRLEMAELLHKHSGMDKGFYTTGGSDAVENAIKLARLFTGRSKIITRRTSYHGATLAVLGVSGDSRKIPFHKDLPPAYHIEDNYPPRPPRDGQPSSWVESLCRVVENEGPETIAAIMLEGMTGVGGMQTPPEDFWPTTRALCDQYGILLIDDEIFSGFGRTGQWWAYQHWGTQPDILVLGKGLTSGYAPMGAALVTEAIAQRFENERLWCGLTYFAHPVSCAAAVATMEVIENDALVDNAARVGSALHKRLDCIAALRSTAGKILDVRGLGLMQTLVFDRPSAPLLNLLWDNGVFASGAENMLFLCPPLCLTEPEMHSVADILESVVSSWN